MFSLQICKRYGMYVDALMFEVTYRIANRALHNNRIITFEYCDFRVVNTLMHATH